MHNPVEDSFYFFSLLDLVILLATPFLTNISGVFIMCKALLNNQRHGLHRSCSQGVWSLGEVLKTLRSSFCIVFSTKVFPVWNVLKELGSF